MRKTKLFLSLLMLLAFSVGNVWADYVKVTSTADITSGDYLIVYEAGNVAFNGALETLDAVSDVVEVTISEGTIASTTAIDAAVFTIDVTAGTIRSASGHYIGIASNSNGLKQSDDATTYTNTFSIDNDGNAEIKANFSGSTMSLRFNKASNQNRFRYYKNAGQEAIQLYKKAAAKPAVSIDSEITGGSVSVTGADDLSAVEPETVLTVTATPDASHKNPVVTITKDEDGSDVTDDVLYDASTGEFLMPDYNITVSASFTAKAQSAVTVTNPDHGTITVTGAEDLTAVMEGTELTIEVEGSGYTFTPKAVGTESNEVVAIVDGKLTMPAFPITITADETEITTPTITLSEDALDFASVAKGAAVPAAKTFTIDGVHLTGDLALAWDAEGNDAFSYEITKGSLTATDGAVSATVAVTPKSTTTAGNFANTLTVSGGGATAQTVEVSFEVLETYTATWYVNGGVAKTQTDVADAELSFPANPVASGDCEGLVFRGWAESALDAKTDEAPAFTDLTAMPEADVNFYAVFATETSTSTDQSLSVDFESETSAYTDWTFTNLTTQQTNSNVNAHGGDYFGTTGGKASGSVVTASKIASPQSVTFYISKTSTNTTASSWLVKVSSDGDTWTTVGDEQDASKDITRGVWTEVTRDLSSYSDVYVGVFYDGTTAVRTIDDVALTAGGTTTSYSGYLTTCESCSKVTFTTSATENGTYTLSATSVRTCDEVTTVNVTFAPAEGYELASFSVEQAEGVSYADGVITIAQGVNGTVQTGASFKQADYTVTMEQTGGAEAAISADQVDKHFDETINISAEDKAGYVFLGWEATPAVTFADASALTTTFAMPASNVTVTAKYAKVYTVAQAIELIEAEGTVSNAVVDGYIYSVDSYNSNYHSITYYIKDLDENGFMATGDAIKVYSGKGLNGANFESVDDIKEGAKVRIMGNLLFYSPDYEINYNNYLLSYTEAANPAVVVYGEASKTEYKSGENFDCTGLSAKLLYENGYAEAIAAEDITWETTPATITASGNVAVTATAGGLTSAAFNVAVTLTAPKFYVAGSFNGNDDWDAGKVASYEDSYTVHLAAGAYDFKVVDNGAWKGFSALTKEEIIAGLYNDASDNIWFTLKSEGDVTITYADGVFKVAGDFEPQTVELAGSWNEWGEHETATLAEDKKSATAAYTFEKDVWVNFKMIVDGNWKGSAGEAISITRSANTAEGLINGGENNHLYFQADVAGEYKFTWVFGTETLTVTFPDQGGTTALDNTAVEAKAVKSLQNGMLIIEKAGVRYNVMGQVIR